MPPLPSRPNLRQAISFRLPYQPLNNQSTFLFAILYFSTALAAGGYIAEYYCSFTKHPTAFAVAGCFWGLSLSTLIAALFCASPSFFVTKIVDNLMKDKVFLMIIGVFSNNLLQLWEDHRGGYKINCFTSLIFTSAGSLVAVVCHFDNLRTMVLLLLGKNITNAVTLAVKQPYSERATDAPNLEPLIISIVLSFVWFAALCHKQERGALRFFEGEQRDHARRHYRDILCFISVSSFLCGFSAPLEFYYGHPYPMYL